ncbi:5-oxoprolinase subunit PxpA [Alkalihalophilus pseudofirmus]|uniref:5-oxoprolinase subunit A n=1 Tax=Alkalihalophilus pseudofirmus TaxID=79885 RepID=A0AAJ2NQC2_ALKPS|nr:5-oxoprolinase subunit PxpA [Alkalihalophilus pseudofirmus]MDV2886670.1 5-oxoprolinase subunit PxpA [Alkalihalophilus pseudofirmus]WEG17394.1 LamB/YcsF family protein [Alkalihalophilus pseudofirmus]
MTRVDLNCDLGESFGAYKIGQDEFILDHISSANVACGYHAGDHNVMAATVKMAKERGVSIGAHPGFQDLMGFGRRQIQTSPEDIYHFVIYQINALKGFCHLNNVSMKHVKPHGALFNMAAKDPVMAKAIAQAVYDTDPSLVLFGLSGSELTKAGEELGLTVANEVFADRTYQPDGSLTPRTEANALIHNTNAAVEQVLQMVKEGTVTAVDGSTVKIKADTVCIHGDGENALSFAQTLREVLTNEGVTIAPVNT